MKKTTYLLLAATLFAASCKKPADPTPTPTPEPATAKVRFTNGCVNSGVLGIKINDVILADAQAINFLGSTGYLKTAYGTSTKISFIYPSTGSIFKESTLGLNADTYSAFVGGEVPNDISMVVINDNLAAPAAGKAKIRFINLGIDNYNISFYVGGPKLDSNIIYKEYTPFYEVTAGSLNIIAQDPANVGYQRTLNGHTIEAGKIYTVMFTGKTGALGDADLKLSVITHN